MGVVWGLPSVNSSRNVQGLHSCRTIFTTFTLFGLSFSACFSLTSPKLVGYQGVVFVYGSSSYQRVQSQGVLRRLHDNGVQVFRVNGRAICRFSRVV